MSRYPALVIALAILVLPFAFILVAAAWVLIALIKLFCLVFRIRMPSYLQMGRRRRYPDDPPSGYGVGAKLAPHGPKPKAPGIAMLD